MFWLYQKTREYLLVVLFFMPAVLFGSLPGIQYLSNWALAQRTPGYVPVTAQLTHFDPPRCGGAGRGSGGPPPSGVRYEYRYGERQYEGRHVVARLNNAALDDCGEALFRSLGLLPYSPDLLPEITVYVDPQNPAEAVMQRGLPLGKKQLAGLLFTALLLWVLAVTVLSPERFSRVVRRRG